MSAQTRWLVLSLLVIVTMIATACAPGAAPAVAPTQAPAATAAPQATQAPQATEAPKATEAPQATTAPARAGDTTIYGVKLPADAAPYDMQTWSEPCDIKANQITFDFQVQVYQRFCGSDLFQDQLVNLDKDFNVIPNSAEKWEVSADGLTWTFHIKKGLQWSDGTPVTANDWVATYQYTADPKHAWDFAWFYAGVLENWDEIIAGDKPTTDLGVKAVDDLTLQFKTKVPWPAFPAMMQFGFLLSKNQMEKYGPLYNSKVETSLSAGPFKLTSLEPGKRIVLDANPMYKGFRQPRLKQIIVNYLDMSTGFAAFQNGEIDHLGYEWITPADMDTIQKDPVLKKNYFPHFGDFRTDYLVMDTFNKPFNDLNVRKAFAYAVDRDAIVQNVLTPIKGMPAHSFLMPGFPASDVDGKLKDLQTYDCPKAKDYLAKAGYPDGKDFPKLEMWLRSEGPAWQAVFQAVAASIASCLNIQIDVSNKDYKVYMDALNARPTKLTFGAISYGMDYLDPSNMLGIFVSTGRHSWKNDQFDALVKQASSMTGDPAKRIQMFQDAEKILVDDVGAVFLDHRWLGDLFQPYIQGDCFRTPDSHGVSAWHWGNDWCWGNFYVSKDVMNVKTYRNQ